MNLQTLLADDAAPSLELVGLSEHTAEVLPGFAFIGVAANDAELCEHSRNAAANGAVVVLCERRSSVAVLDANDLSVPIVQVSELSAKRGSMAAKFYGDPSSHQTCIGVTGTNGKTSVAYHLADLSALLGQPMGYSGTLGWGSLDALQPVNMTTGNAVSLQRNLAAMLDLGLTGVALEVSSHALAQDRAQSVQFDVAIFTNLTRDHLDYHGSFEAYGAAKQKLFTDWPLKAAVLNADDEFGRTLARGCDAVVVTYGKAGQWSWQSQMLPDGLAVSWQTPFGQFDARLAVVADYAIANITAAIAALVAMGHPADEVFAQVPFMQGVPGRMEVVKGFSEQPTVVVDYAHTPDALSKVLAALRPFCRGQLICVVGCGGDRDKGKRPLMGAAAAAGSDLVWLTSDNPRSEPPQNIVDAMAKGVVDVPVHECLDRAEAIDGAISNATASDMVLVAGKGHEDYQEINGQRLPFDDRQVVARVLGGLG